MSSGKRIWLEAAHEEFAKNGPICLKIDLLSRIVSKSRSSFYNLFHDMETFEQELLDYSLEITSAFSAESANIERFFPDYARQMVKYKNMLFFNQQLFLRQHSDEQYRKTWEKVMDLVDDKAEVLWMKLVKLDNLPPAQREKFYLTIRTAAFVQLKYEDYNYENIYRVVSDINRSFGFLLPADQ